MLCYDQLERILGDAASAYADACKRHPVFPKNPSSNTTMTLQIILGEIRQLNHRDDDPSCTIRSIQSEELLEAIVEAKKGDWTAAKQETLHLIATALRAYEYYSLEGEKLDGRVEKSEGTAECPYQDDGVEFTAEERDGTF